MVAMRLFRSSEILGIARETLEFALEASEATHPNEYMGLFGVRTPASSILNGAARSSPTCW